VPGQVSLKQPAKGIDGRRWSTETQILLSHGEGRRQLMVRPGNSRSRHSRGRCPLSSRRVLMRAPPSEAIRYVGIQFAHVLHQHDSVTWHATRVVLSFGVSSSAISRLLLNHRRTYAVRMPPNHHTGGRTQASIKPRARDTSPCGAGAACRRARAAPGSSSSLYSSLISPAS